MNDPHQPLPSAPSRPLHEWRSVLHQKQWDRATWRTTLWWVRQALRRTPEIARQARRNLRRYGSRVENEYGISRSRQFLRQCYIAFRHDTSPTTYYTYFLYEPERWEVSHTLLYDSWKSHRYMVYTLYTLSDTPPDEKEVLNDKLLFFDRCETHDLPTPSLLAVFEDGTVRRPRDAAPSLPRKDVFVKPRAGSKGQGAAKYTYVGEDCWLNGDASYDSSALFGALEKRSEDEAVLLQPALRNDASWGPFTSGALASVRLITGRTPQGDITPLGAKLRMPVGDTHVDNISAGGIFSQVELDSGRMSMGVSMRPIDDTFRHESHPDTGHPLPGAILPHWEEVVQLGCRAHSACDVITIGWDIALTTDGLSILEGNCGWSANLLLIPQIRLHRYAILYDAWMQKLGDRIP